MLKTPLAKHIDHLNPRFGEFAGWEMPLFFSSAAKEHLAVRENAGIFDISHMGQVFCEGKQAEAFLNSQLTNDVSKLKSGRSHYSFFLNEKGGVIDDLLVYRITENKFFIIFNASTIEQVLSLLQPKAISQNIALTQRKDFIGLALQGPKVAALAPELIGTSIPSQRNHLISTSHDTIVATTGYTGEHGFEWFGPADIGCALWQKALELGISPCGLVARDSLRLEAGLPLNGQDLSTERSPTSAGLSFAVKLNKDSDFPGKSVLTDETTSQKLQGFSLKGTGPIPRTGQTLHTNDGQQVAVVTSGGRPPTQELGIGLAWFESSFLDQPSEINLLVREKSFPVTLTKIPFISK